MLPEIDRLQLTDEPGDLAPALAEAVEILADPRAPHAKEVIFLSDFQRSRGGHGVDDTSGKSDVPALLRKLGEKARLVLIGVGDGRTDNTAITSLTAADPIVLPDRPARLRAAVRNFGPATAGESARASFTRTAIWSPSRRSTCRPEKKRSSSFSYEFRRSGEHAVEMRLPADRLAADNRGGSACRSPIGSTCSW